MLPGAQQANLQRQCGQERPDKQPLGASLAQAKAVQHRHFRLGASPRRKVACGKFMAKDNGAPALYGGRDGFTLRYGQTFSSSRRLPPAC
jgi:hypothetical protein